MPRLPETIDKEPESTLVEPSKLESQRGLRPVLTPRQALFCKEYTRDLNAAAAARRAGFSERGSNTQGAQLLAKPSIQVEIRRLVAERAKRVEVDADWVVRRLVENVQRAMQVVPVLDSDGNPIGEYRWSGAVANKSLELLGKHLGMFMDKQEIAHSVRRVDDNHLSILLQEVEATRRNQIITGELIEPEAMACLEHWGRM